MQYVAHRSEGQQKYRYAAVSLTSIVLGAALICQIMYVYFPSYAIGLIIAICSVHSYVELGEKKEKAIHDHIASAMAQDYEAIYYIEMNSGEYMEFSKSQKYQSMNVPFAGKDFFAETMENIERYVHPEDKEHARCMYNKAVLLKNLEGRHSFSFKYRVMVLGEPRFFLFTVMRAQEGPFIILYEKDIHDELKAEKSRKENLKKTVTFSQIAESLASNYDVIYYIDIADSSYFSYEVNNIYGSLRIGRSGEDFFLDSSKNIPKVVHEQDCERVLEFIDKDRMLSSLEDHKDCSIKYRIVVSGDARYVRMFARKTSDNTHFIVGVENIDAEIRKEKEHLEELKTEKELARRDELTGVKNKTAYKELEKSVQSNIDNGLDYLPFAILVCDTNNLKLINDTKGHVAGDEYIKASSGLLCEIFAHSPVFRVGGDEFVVFLRGNDYLSRVELVNKLRSRVLENQKAGEGPVLAAGMAQYEPASDKLVQEIFDRADKEMYADKERLKKQ